MLMIGREALRLAEVEKFLRGPAPLRLTDDVRADAGRGRGWLEKVLADEIPVYGVTTGFGDSCHRVIPARRSAELQKNLVSYLLCGSGEPLPYRAVKAAFLIRLKSLSRGYSGVSPELLARMELYLNRDWIPVIPREGSLGASGDLIPLAYLARALQGEGEVFASESGRPGAGAAPLTRPLPDLLQQAGVAPYELKPKEGLALVNGTSAMAGMAVYNLVRGRQLLSLAAVGTAWLTLALRGRTEAFGKLVNETASRHRGQARVARRVRGLLLAENYEPRPYADIEVRSQVTSEFVQDRYSLRCVPQILGPVEDTLEQVGAWLEEEINGVSDNPLFGEDGLLATGGNFYGGYLSQGMDYLKISLGHLADLYDRQLTLLMDEKSNRGLPPNLANWDGLPDEERFLHHGLKGLHQAVGALTSEVLALAVPNGIFSRSAESHNQDKVSLGMSAAVQCHLMLEKIFTIQAVHLICLAQALDLRGVKLRGADSARLYQQVRRHVPFADRDRETGSAIRDFALFLQDEAWKEAGDPQASRGTGGDAGRVAPEPKP